MIFHHFFSALLRNLLLSFDVSSIEKVKKCVIFYENQLFFDEKMLVILSRSVFNLVLNSMLSKSGTILTKSTKNDEKVWKSGVKNMRILCTICARIFDMAYKMAFKNNINSHMCEIGDFETP